MTDNKEPIPIALWNPRWTIIWSFIFSPAFGTFLQRLNWREMGEIQKAQTSANWFYFTLCLLVILLFGEPFFPEDAPLADYWFFIIWVIWYVIWIFANGTKQIKVVDSRYGNNYHHKLWGRPIMIGACGLVLWTIASATYVVGLILTGIIVITN